MALTYITNGKIVLPDLVLCGKFLAFDSDSGKICGIVDNKSKKRRNHSVINRYSENGIRVHDSE